MVKDPEAQYEVHALQPEQFSTSNTGSHLYFMTLK